jgi:hypothetical protein
MYRVTLDDGCSVVCDADHLWFTKTRSERKHDRSGKVRTTREIAESLTFPNGPREGLNHQIPTVGAVEYPAGLLPVEAYTLGVWLGDGSATSQYCEGTSEVAEALMAAGCEVGRARVYEGKAAIRTLHGVGAGLRALGLFGLRCHEKFIPDLYIHSPDRLAVLQGLLDTDGTVGKNNAVVLDITSKRLADGAAEIVRSLGGVVRRGEKWGQYNGKRCRRVYRLYISLPEGISPFRIPSKANRYKPSHDHKNRQRTLRRFIKSVDPVGKSEAVCISVAHPSSLYVTKSHIVTHNTTLLAWVAIWFIMTRKPAEVLITANSQDQLRDVVFKNIAIWAGRMPKQMRGLLDVSSQRCTLKPLPENFIVGRTAGPDNTEALQGFHGENFLIILEEASGLEEQVIEVAHGTLSDPNAKILAVGNPTRVGGFFYDLFHKLRDKWTTQVVSSEDVPQARGHIDDIITRYGIDSNQYRVRVLGEFPTADDDVVIPLHLIESAVSREVELIPGYRTVWGVDPARFGNDRTAVAKRCGNHLLQPVEFWQNASTTETAGRLKNEYMALEDEDRPSEILIDSIGLGAGVADAARDLGLPVREVNVSESPNIKGQFQRRRDELYFEMAEWFKNRNCKIPDDAGLIAELCDIRYDIMPNGNTKVEPKHEMKKRVGRSPDLADAFLLTFAGGMDKIDDHAIDRYAHPRRRRRMKGWSSWAA